MNLLLGCTLGHSCMHASEHTHSDTYIRVGLITCFVLVYTCMYRCRKSEELEEGSLHA